MNSHLICLSIESTAHTIAVSILTSDNHILADLRSVYKPKQGGLIPVEVAEHHKKEIDSLVEHSLQKANYPKINLIAYSNAPGLAPCLNVGQRKAVELSKSLKVPLIPVNHVLAHLYSAHQFTPAKDPLYIFTSGANTQIIIKDSHHFRILGETLDIGLGNALDKFGRIIEIPFPAGPEIEKLAKKGKYTELPYTIKGMDLAFSGVITAAQTKFKKGATKPDLCYSLQETLFAMLTEVTERALAYTKKQELVLIGGVAANQRLIKMLNIMSEQRKTKLYTVPIEYTGDQAVMIAYTGIKLFQNNIIREPKIEPYQRIDELKIQ